MAYRLGRNILLIATALTAVGCQTNKVAKAMNPKQAASASLARIQTQIRAAAERQERLDGIGVAEQAVRSAPDSLEARKTLAQAYFDAGRFRSAAQAYGDVLALAPADDSLRLKRALSLLAQGNQRASLAELDQVRDARNAGLAYALAGRPDRGIELLSQAAREDDATPRTRQNLALALALAGKWAQARTVAAQDLDPATVETRVRQWAEFAASGDPVAQTASLLGVAPIISDEGRPIGLAYVPPSERLVQVATAPVETIAVAAVPPAEDVSDHVQPPASRSLAARSGAAMTGQWVVQLGAYDRPELLEANWHRFIRGNAGLVGGHDAVRSEVMVGDRRFHRLSLAGFDSRSAAIGLCEALQARGRDCFVRNLSPAAVQVARAGNPSRA